MLLPIGFGSKLRKYPFGIFAIVFTCVIWSVLFFSNVKIVSKESNNQADIAKHTLLLTQTLYESCNLYFANQDTETKKNCDQFKTLNSMSRQIASENFKNKTLMNEFTKTEKEMFSSEKLKPFMKELSGEPKQWPEKYKYTSSYIEFEKFNNKVKEKIQEAHNQNGFLTPQKKNIFRVIQAAFTHASWEHLLSNLLILILFGIWVEQAVGSLETLLIFVAGSYVGLSLEIYLNHPPAVLGASAGIMAVMGAFYILFYHAELTFFIFFRKVHIPCKWIFPCLFLADDLLQIGNHQQNGIAHWAHFGGMLIGLGLGWLFRSQMNLSSQELFPQEMILLRKLERSKNDKESLFLFSELMSYNPRHFLAFQLILQKIKNKQVSLKEVSKISKFENNIKFFMKFLMQRRPVGEMLQILSLFPENVSLSHCLQETPLSQVLFLADQVAQQEKYSIAQRLYQLALNKNPNREQINRINAALKYITQMQSAA